MQGNKTRQLIIIVHIALFLNLQKVTIMFLEYVNIKHIKNVAFIQLLAILHMDSKNTFVFKHQLGNQPTNVLPTHITD